MHPTSSEFLSKLKGNGYTYNCKLVQGEGSTANEFPIIAGNVDVEFSADVRRRFRCDVIDPQNRSINELKSILNSFGTEVKILWGLQLADETFEYIPLGVFRINERIISGNSSDGVVISLAGLDRASILQRKGVVPPTVNGGSKIYDAIIALLLTAYPGISFIAPPIAKRYLTPPLIGNDSPWALISSLAESIGCSIFFNSEGVPTMTPVIDPFSSSVMTLREGSTNIVTNYTVTSSSDNVPSVVLISATSITGKNEIRGYSFDTDPTSLTYYKGTYGIVVEEIKSEKVLSQEQADALAQAQLQRLAGSGESLVIRHAPLPMVEAGDKFKIISPSYDLNKDFYLSRTSIPLTMDEQESSFSAIILGGSNG